MIELLKIAGGTIYDPANGVDGDVRDLWAQKDRREDKSGSDQVRR